VNYGPLIFLGAFFALAASWFGFVLAPEMQIGHLQQTNTIAVGATYPAGRPGLARQGLEVYRANGCAYCHTQQVQQDGTACEVLLTDIGTNQTAVAAALVSRGIATSQEEARRLLVDVPKTIRKGARRSAADQDVTVIGATGAKAEVWIVPIGRDIARGWGKRRTVAEDFLYDSPVMLGSRRLGPDLANVGVRLPDANWQLLHLYAPQALVPGSTMPPFRFLFEKRRIERTPSPDALVLPPPLDPGPGYEIVPKSEAKALAAYLISLRADAPLFNAPLSVPLAPPPADTNAAAGATNAPATNAPAK
jgi:cbb3-type cytochrome oxidase cytochrome c subunit